MSRVRIEAPYMVPRRYVPSELRASLIGNLDDSGALAIAYLIKRRMQERARPPRMVFVDIDHAVYATRPSSVSAELLAATHPELLVGVYNARAEAAEIAADLETHRRLS